MDFSGRRLLVISFKSWYPAATCFQSGKLNCLGDDFGICSSAPYVWLSLVRCLSRRGFLQEMTPERVSVCSFFLVRQGIRVQSVSGSFRTSSYMFQALRLSSYPRCQASWSVGPAGQLVLLVALDARHHGRYEPEGQLLSGFASLAVPFWTARDESCTLVQPRPLMDVTS